MTDNDIGFLDYAKAAFYNQYNLILSSGVLGLAMLSGHWKAILPVWIGAELLWILGLSTNERYQNIVRALLKKQQQANLEHSHEEMLAELPQSYQFRYNELRKCYQDIQQSVATADHASVTLWQSQIDKLAFVLSSFVRLAHYQVNLHQLMANFNQEQVQNELQEIGKKAEDASDYLRQQYQKYIAIMQSRLEKFHKAKEVREAIRVQLNIIEEQLKLIREQIFLVRNPQDLTAQLDFLVAGINEIETQGSLFLDLQAELSQAAAPAQQSKSSAQAAKKQRQKELES